MHAPTVTRQFASLEDRLDGAEYNFEHFRPTHLLADVQATLKTRGIRPGKIAPDFELPRVGGGSLRLGELRDKPTLLHFGSFTWPITTGSVEPLKKLHRRWGDRVHFVDVVIRQAHLGPRARPYHEYQEKARDAQTYRREEGIPWPVLVDDLPGTVHQTYGGLADPTYLIDADGRVAYYNMWTYAPALHEAIEALLQQGGRGIVLGGVRRTPNLGPTMTDGWRGLQRGLPQSFVDLELATPGSASGAWLGYQLRPLLAPLTLRAEPLPAAARLGLTAGVVLVAALGAWRAMRR